MRRILLCLVLATSTAYARSEKTLAYEREPAWATAVRFIRVNAGLKVIEKNANAGYVIFEFKEEKKDEGYFRTERTYGEFCRFIPLPEGVLTDKIAATFNDGVLEVVAPFEKPEKVLPKKVAID